MKVEVCKAVAERRAVQAGNHCSAGILAATVDGFAQPRRLALLKIGRQITNVRRLESLSADLERHRYAIRGRRISDHPGFSQQFGAALPKRFRKLIATFPSVIYIAQR
jgi:hypothetical protein